MSITKSLKHFQTNEKYLIVSLHDLHPGSFHIYKEFYEKFMQLGLKKSSILVVPNMHNKYILESDPNLIEWLKELDKQGNDICLHGYYHKVYKIYGGVLNWLVGAIYTDYEGEFYQLNYTEAKSRIEKGLNLLKSLSINAVGFTPPAWLISKDAIKALKDLGLSYLTTLRGIINLKKNEFIPIPVLVLSSRNIIRRLFSRMFITCYHILLFHTPILRLALHPIDLIHEKNRIFLLNLLEKLLSKRIPITYRDLI